MNEPSARHELILASRSGVRAKLLARAGVKVAIEPADIDEAAVRESLSLDGGQTPPDDVAAILSEAKAQTVAARHPRAYVIGADQVLAFQGEIFAKPETYREAYAHLRRLRGKTHSLHASVVCVRDDETLWRHVGTAHLTMRDFSDAFIERYLERVGEQAFASVGAYQLEGLGAQLFEEIDGDYFTILGLPLLPLLAFLRAQGVLVS